jgi:hypothetical protein
MINVSHDLGAITQVSEKNSCNGMREENCFKKEPPRKILKGTYSSLYLWNGKNRYLNFSLTGLPTFYARKATPNPESIN